MFAKPYSWPDIRCKLFITTYIILYLMPIFGYVNTTTLSIYPRFVLMLSIVLLGFSAQAQGPYLGADTAYCDYDALELDAGSGYISYNWSTVENTQTIDVLGSGLYWVEVVDSQFNIYRDTIVITVYELPEPNFLGTNACEGTATEFTNFSIFDQDSIVYYWWDFGDGDTSGIYEPDHLYAAPGVKNVTLVAANTNGCVDTTRALVEVFAAPIVDAGSSVSINVGDTVQLSGTVPTDSFYWTPPNFLSADTILDPLAFPNNTIDYTLVGVDTLGCEGTDDVNIYVNLAPITENDQVTVPANGSAEADVQANDVDPNGDALITTILSGPTNGTATVNSDSTISYTPNENYNGRDTIYYQVCDAGTPALCTPGILVLVVTNAAPVGVDDEADTEVETAVEIDLLSNDYDPNQQNIFISETGDPLFGSLLDGGVGSVTYIPNALFTGVDSFYYLICDDGLPILCDSAWVYITVTAKPLEIPNSFSPNGDGMLDLFVIDGIGTYPGNKLTIFSRWGDVVLEVNDYENNWDGTRDFNEQLAEGIYYYTLDLSDGGDPMTGYIMLKR